VDKTFMPLDCTRLFQEADEASPNASDKRDGFSVRFLRAVLKAQCGHPLPSQTCPESLIPQAREQERIAKLYLRGHPHDPPNFDLQVQCLNSKDFDERLAASPSPEVFDAGLAAVSARNLPVAQGYQYTWDV
jgi:hypothetical protein